VTRPSCARAALLGGIVAAGALAAAPQADAVATPEVANCAGVSITFQDVPGTPFFVLPATASAPNEAWLYAVTPSGIETSPIQTFTTIGATLTFPWSSVGVDTTGGGTVEYYFGFRDTNGETGYIASPAASLELPQPSNYFSYAAQGCVPAAAVTATTSAPASATTTLAPTTPAPLIPTVAAASDTATLRPRATVAVKARAAAVAGATSVRTGEPFAGTGPLAAALAAGGMLLLGFGAVLRRRRASDLE
jgi:hypothetical protein